MVQKEKAPELSPPTEGPPKAGEAELKPPEIVDLLGKVDKLLREGQPERGLETAGRAGLKSPWVTNTLGVCQLRLGNSRVAVDVFRGLVLGTGGLVLRQDVPAVFKTNYATALLLSGNVSGGLRALDEVQDEQSPAVGKLREAVRRWVRGLPFWQRVNWWLGGEPDCPLALDFPPGDLE